MQMYDSRLLFPKLRLNPQSFHFLFLFDIRDSLFHILIQHHLLSVKRGQCRGGPHDRSTVWLNVQRPPQ